MKQWAACVTMIGLGSTLLMGCESNTADKANTVEQGPYAPTKPQALPRERDVAPFGVGAGSDNSGMSAREQFHQTHDPKPAAPAHAAPSEHAAPADHAAPSEHAAPADHAAPSGH